ncbi:hypothetical protein SAMN04488137_2248 [Fictibacillus solisalsi]|uniref:Uncharacterized protein n=1 Tax=Fictibacillus solisalsi TaxID=459525 RepID=A0A1G9WM45_9BACL|nr:hypothetical protein [Fictibacillus solisalsi]SDM85323.1 hypothetical protein SAMN04488137_2248 [Fictibacillus solisalsi]
MSDLQVETGSILLEDVYTSNGVLLLKKGTILNTTHVELFQKHNVERVKTVQLTNPEDILNTLK